MYIYFASDGSVQDSGFSLSYELAIPPTCSSNEFTCDDGSCINNTQVCDDNFDCPGDSYEDESACTTTTASLTSPSIDLNIILSCTSNCDLERVNPSEPFGVQATCAACTDAAQYEWEITYYESDQWNTVGIGNTTGLNSQDLLIKGSMLTATNYTVQAKVTDGLYSGNNTLIFVTNAPPTGGSCNSSVVSGYALQDEFSFGCYEWQDSSGEIITYKFYYQVKGTSNKNLMILTGDGVSDNNLLPNGKPEYDYQVDIIINIYDEYGLSTFYTFPITVQEAQFDDGDEFYGFMSNLTSGEEIDLGLNSVVASIINYESDKKESEQTLSKEQRTQLKEEIMLSVANASDSVNTTDKIDQGAGLIRSLTEKKEEITTSAMVETSKALKNIATKLSNIENEATEDVVKICTDMSSGAGNVLTANHNSTKIDNSVTDNIFLAVDDVASTVTGKMSPGEDRELNSDSLQLSLSKARKKDAGEKTLSSSSGAAVKLPSASLLLQNQSDSEVVSSKLVALNGNPYYDNSSHLLKSKVLTFSFEDSSGESISVNGLEEQIILEIPNIVSTQTNPVAVTSNDMLDEVHYLYVITVNNFNQESLILRMIDVKECKSGSNITIFMFMNLTDEYNYTDTQECNQSLVNYTFKIHKEEFLIPDLYYINITQENPIDMSIQSFTARCRFWNESAEIWDESGCEELKESTPEITRCGCTHLSTFASGMSFYPPEPFDWAAVLAGFQNLGDNAAVFSVIFVVLGLYLLVIYFAYKADNSDRTKWSATVLNTTSSKNPYHYHLFVNTGSMGGADTMSKVSFILEGSETKTDVICMNDGDLEKRKGFTRGSVRQFLLQTATPLGNLRTLRIWHDNSGKYAERSWYLSKITVVDIEKKEKYYFVCERWLAVERDDGRVERLLKIASEADLRQVKPMFSTNAHFNLTDSHLWVSVWSRPRKSRFTRVQRISCCLSLLYCTMVANCMWYQQTKQQGNDMVLKIGPIALSWKAIQIGIMSSLVVLPINVFIIQLFRKSRPADTKKCWCCTGGAINPEIDREEEVLNNSKEQFSVEDELQYELERLDTSLSTKMDRALIEKNGLNKEVSTSTLESGPRERLKNNGPLHQFDDETLKNIINGEVGSKAKSKNHHQRSLQAGDFSKDESSITGEGSSEKFPQAAVYVNPETVKKTSHSTNRKKDAFMLPYWCVYVAWTLVVLTCLVSAAFTIFYSLQWGAEDSNKWLLAFFISFFEDVILLQPIKIFVLAIIVTMILKKYEGENEDDTQTSIYYDKSMNIDICEEPTMTKDVNPKLLEKLKEQREKEIKLIKMIKEIIIYLIFLGLLWFIAYGARDKNAVFFNQSINKTIFDHEKFNQITLGFAPLYSWAEKFLLPELFTTAYYNGQSLKDADKSLFGDFAAYRMGSPRFRQIRVKDVCVPTKKLSELATHCTVDYYTSNEDRADYGKNWLSFDPNDTSSYSEFWQYRSDIELEGLAIYGFVSSYPGGGYVANLGSTYGTANEALTYLWNNTWLDSFTRALIIEFNLYNPSVNLFGSVRVILEYPSSGGAFAGIDIDILRLSNYVGSLWMALVIIELIFVALLLYYIANELTAMYKEKIGYFKSFWNMIEISKILACVIATVYFILKAVTRLTSLSNIASADPGQFVNLQKVALYDEMYRYMIAFVVFFSTLKMWHILRFNKKIRILSLTLSRARNQILAFFVIFFIVFFAFGHLFYLSVGTKLLEYHHIWSAIQTLFGMWLGNFDFNTLKTTARIVGPLFFFTFILLVYMVLALIFVTIIVIAFNEIKLETMNVRNEYEVADYIKNNIKSIIGIPPDDDDEIDQLPEDTTKTGNNLNYSKDKPIVELKKNALLSENKKYGLPRLKTLEDRIARIRNYVNNESRERKLFKDFENIRLIEASRNSKTTEGINNLKTILNETIILENKQA